MEHTWTENLLEDNANVNNMQTGNRVDQDILERQCGRKWQANEDYIQAFIRQRNEESGRREETEGE